MCRIERFNLIFPDGHSEVREQLVNTCPRGTPSSPCHHREYLQVFRDRFATREENDEYLRRTAPVIEPGPSLKEIRKSRKPKSVLQGLGIGFKMWRPFSSEKKEKAREKYVITERRNRSPNQLTVVPPMVRAPSPPPAWTPRPQEPFYMTAEPREGCGRPTNRHWEEEEPKEIRPKRKSAGRRIPVIIHQEKKKKREKFRREHEKSDSDSEDDESSTARVRPYHRPHRSHSPAPIIITPNRELERERRRRHRAERNAEAEHYARLRAERNAAAEQREQRRIADHDRLRLESAERAARRARLEEQQRARNAQEHQRDLDSEIIRRRSLGLTSRQPTRYRPVSLHHHDDRGMGGRGDDLIDEAIANAEANMRRNAEAQWRGGRGEAQWPGGRGGRGRLMRRNTVDGTQGRGYGGYRRGHARGRYGGSS